MVRAAAIAGEGREDGQPDVAGATVSRWGVRRRGRQGSNGGAGRRWPTVVAPAVGRRDGRTAAARGKGACAREKKVGTSEGEEGRQRPHRAGDCSQGGEGAAGSGSGGGWWQRRPG